MRWCRSDWPGLCLFCCTSCVVSQQSWFGFFFVYVIWLLSALVVLVCYCLFFVWSFRLFGSWLAPLRQYSLSKFLSFPPPPPKEAAAELEAAFLKPPQPAETKRTKGLDNNGRGRGISWTNKIGKTIEIYRRFIEIQSFFERNEGLIVYYPNTVESDKKKLEWNEREMEILVNLPRTHRECCQYMQIFCLYTMMYEYKCMEIRRLYMICMKSLVNLPRTHNQWVVEKYENVLRSLVCIATTHTHTQYLTMNYYNTIIQYVW